MQSTLAFGTEALVQCTRRPHTLGARSPLPNLSQRNRTKRFGDKAKFCIFGTHDILFLIKEPFKYLDKPSAATLIQRIKEFSKKKVEMSDEAIAEANAKNPRFTHWCANLVFSVITMWSAIVVIKTNGAGSNTQNHSKDYERWAMITTAITLGLSGLAVLFYIVPPTRRFFEGKVLEGILVLLMLGWWCAAVAVITDSKNGVAVDSSGAVSNGNVYYFSWAGFVSSITLFVSYMRTVYGVDIEGEIQSRAARLNLWSAMIATSAIVCGSSVVVFVRTCNSLKKTGRDPIATGTYCMRSIYGISVGGGGVFMAMIIVALKLCLSKMPLILETICAYILLPAWCVGVAFITSHAGPGSGLGNLYYFTWLSFILSFMLAASTTDDRKRKDLASDVV